MCRIKKLHGLQVSVALYQSREDGPVEDCAGSELQQPHLASQQQAASILHWSEVQTLLNLKAAV